MNIIRVTSSGSAASALLGYAQEEQEMFEGEEVEPEPSQSSCPAYDELLEVMERKKKAFLFFLISMRRLRRSEKSNFSHIQRFQHTSYADIEGMCENGYEGMPPVEETIASYLSVGETSSLKAPSLPSKPLNLT